MWNAHVKTPPLTSCLEDEEVRMVLIFQLVTPAVCSPGVTSITLMKAVSILVLRCV